MVAPAGPIAFGAISGLLIGTVGFFAEYGWSHVWMPVPWPESLIGEAIVPALVTAIAAGVLGAFLGASFTAAGTDGARCRAGARRGGRAVAIIAVVGLNVGDRTPSGWSARVSLTTTSKPGRARTVNATVRLDPPTIADDAFWVQAISWQGGGLSSTSSSASPRASTGRPSRCRYTAPGRPDPPAPRQLRRRPAHLPAGGHGDPGAGGSAPARFERPFVDETEILQREQKSDVPDTSSRSPTRSSPRSCSGSCSCSAGCWTGSPAPDDVRRGRRRPSVARHRARRAEVPARPPPRARRALADRARLRGRAVMSSGA